MHVVDVVVHLTITKSCTRHHKWQRPRARSHVHLDVDSSTPSVQRGSGRRDPPDTPPHTSPSVWTTNYNSGRASLSRDEIWAATMQGRGGSRSVWHGGEGGVYIEEEGQPPRGGRPRRVSSSSWPSLHSLVTPSSTWGNPHFNAWHSCQLKFTLIDLIKHFYFFNIC